MSTATLEPRVHAPRNYLNADYGWKSWLFTLDHKRIALLYLVSITFFFVIGGSFAVLMRIDVSRELQELQILINSFNLNKPDARRFTHRLDDARRAWTRHLKHEHGVRAFCEELAEFISTVQAQAGNTLTADEATQLVTVAELIASEAGCGF